MIARKKLMMIYQKVNLLCGKPAEDTRIFTRNYDKIGSRNAVSELNQLNRTLDLQVRG